MNRFNTTVSRRRLLAVGGTGAFGLAAAALVGCASGSGKPAETANKPGSAVGAPSQPSAEKPKPGGIIRYPNNRDTDGIDPNISAGATPQIPAANVYSRLFVFEPGVGKPASGKIVGDLVEKWEQQDPLTMILHLNPAAKFDEREPLNGRALNSADVVETWKRFAAKGYYRANLSNAANKDAPIESVEAVDASTVKIKSKFPAGYLLSLIVTGLPIQPVEGVSGGKIDLSKEMRGTGPFLFESYKNGISMSFKRNPKWFGAGANGLPYADRIEIPIIPDQGQLDVQFRSKNLQFGAVSRTNIPTFAKELKDTEVTTASIPSGSLFLAMSYAPGQPWHDIRVRRALSMTIDRDQLADVILGPKEFEAIGVKLGIKWNAPISGGYGDFWIDPKSSKFGPATAYLQKNIAEATKLLAAAGYSKEKPLEFEVFYPGTYYNPDWPTRLETMQSMMRDANVKMNLAPIDYATDYIAKIAQSGANFKGRKVEAAMRLHPGGGQADPLPFLIAHYGSGGLTNGVGKKFPELDDMLRTQRDILKFEDRVAGMHDVSRWIVDNMAGIPVGPDSESVDLGWSALQGPQNYRSWQGSSAASSTSILFPNYWFKGQL